jgi:hypothetical protein
VLLVRRQRQATRFVVRIIGRRFQNGKVPVALSRVNAGCAGPVFGQQHEVVATVQDRFNLIRLAGKGPGPRRNAAKRQVVQIQNVQEPLDLGDKVQLAAAHGNPLGIRLCERV